MAPSKRSSEGSTEPSSTPFGPPFDDADADTILRSSDQVDFHVYRVMLSKSSPFFKSMFSLPQSDTSVTEKPDRPPVINLTENSRTIAILLAFVYPVVSVVTEPMSLDDMTNAFAAATKYDMTAVSQRLTQRFTVSKSVQDSPVEAFCAAYSCEWREAARIGAKASLKHRLNLDTIGNKLQHTNGPGLHQLWKFHRACSATAAGAISSTHLTWITSSDRTWWDSVHTICRQPHNCRKYRYAVGPLGEKWDATPPWHNYIKHAHNVLLEHPCKEAVADCSVLKPSYEENMCSDCQYTLISLPEFIRLLGEEVERRVSKVDLELPF
ncbi:hypothetical protein H4582DRAFT_1938315 [Lactarius indigo]|nr:hypothetical protein H4582DRAFT_1938315 [Lactarius indigo]